MITDMKTIYALLDPRTEQVKYVGATSLKLSERVRRHRSNAKKRPTPVSVWLRDLAANNLRPIATVLEVTGDRGAEKRWTLGFKQQGESLVNVCNMREPEPPKPRHIRNQRGEANPSSKLTQAQVIEIRKAYPAKSQGKLAKIYGVTTVQVGHIVNGKHWTHLEAA